jgi:hypothetical protein
MQADTANASHDRVQRQLLLILGRGHEAAESMRQALSDAGFDLACGFLHADRRGRDALVYDVMELARPAVDDRVLTFLHSTTFHRGDFTRVSDGSCRLHPQLARAVVAACSVPQQRLTEDAVWQRTLLLQ